MTAATMTRSRGWLGGLIDGWRRERLRRDIESTERYCAQLERAMREHRYRQQQLRVRLALLER